MRLSERTIAGALVLGAALVGLLGACGTGEGDRTASATSTVSERPAAVLDAAGLPVGLERYRRRSDRIGQGGEPHGEVAFRNLAALGYHTVVSVDGARPDVETAAKYGLRYVHVPFGYDGVPRESQIRLARAVETAEGPVYVHCHHGQHRGPAGVAFARMAVEGITPEAAIQELHEAECSEKYKGLYRDVGAFQPFTADELASAPAELASYVSPGGVAEQMAVMDRTWERMKAIRKAEWTVPADQPDVDPPHEARMLWESLREIGRLDESRDQGEEYLTELHGAEEKAQVLEEALRRNDKAAAGQAFDGVKKSCDSCHARYRD